MAYAGEIPLNEVPFFDIATVNGATGQSTNADVTPTFDVFEEDTDVAILASQSMTLRVGATGLYRGTFTCSAANGFEVGKFYSVIANATVASVTAKAPAMNFRLRPAELVTGVPIVDLGYTLGTTSAGVAGSVRADAVTGAVGSVTGLTAADVGAIKTKTDFLPSATAGAAGGVFIAGANAATSITTALTANITGNITGNLSGSVGSVTGAVGSVTGAVGSVTGLTASDVGAIKTKTDFLPSATAGAAGGLFIAGTNAATTVTTALTTTFTGNLTGSVGSVTGAVGSVTGAVGSVTGNVGGNVTGSVGSVVGAVGSVTGNVGGNVTGSVGSVTGNVGGNVVGSVASVTAAVSLTASYDFAKGTVAVTESYAANGVAPTPVQAMMAIHQMLMDFSISGTAYTVKKLDNSTTALVVTLNDATSPTAAART